MKAETVITLTFDEDDKIEDIIRSKIKCLMAIEKTKQQDLADAIGVLQTDISKITSGAQGVSFSCVEKIGKYYNYDLSEMVSRNDFVIKKDITDAMGKKQSYYKKKKKRDIALV